MESADFIAPVRRSKEIKAVCAALHAETERGVVRSFQEGKLRVGRMNIDVSWQDGRTSRLRIDIEAATLTFAALLRMTEQAGKVSLGIIVTSGEYEYCTRRLVHLAWEAFSVLPERKPLGDGYRASALTSARCPESTV